jgi:Na+/melibiose symporter-like transporter
MTILAYQVFMKENPDGTGGITELPGYLPYSICGALLIFAAILVSSITTHKQIPYLRQVPVRKLDIKRTAGEILHTLTNRNFFVLAGAGILNAVAGGLHHSLTLYFNLYYWALSQTQLSILATTATVAVILGVSLAPIVSAWLGKKRATIILYLTALTLMVGPLVLRMLGLAPENGTTALIVLLVGGTLVSGTLAAATTILLISMLADVVEEAEVTTGRRSEGLIFSADQLFKKIVSGMGVFVSGLILGWINFPRDAVRGAVEQPILDALALSYLPAFFLFAGAGAFGLFFLTGTRESHEANLQTLRERSVRSAQAGEEQSQLGVAPPLGSLPKSAIERTAEA